MMPTRKTALMSSRFSLKLFFWLTISNLLFSTSEILSQHIANVLSKVGDEAKLPCSYKIPAEKSLGSYIIYWQKATNETDLVVISYKYGEEDETYKNSLYKNRTKMDKRNLTLSISPVNISDSGTYTCFALLEMSNVGEGSVNLSVIVPFSQPIIHYNLSSGPCGPVELMLSCFSHGGYSLPRMYGFVNSRTVDWKYTVISDNQSRSFNITGNLLLNMTENITVKCSVGFLDFQVSANDSLSMPTECPPPAMLPPLSSPSFGIIISSTVILIFLLAVVMLAIFLQQCSHRHLRSSTTHQPVATEEMILQSLPEYRNQHLHEPSELGRKA